MKKKYFFFIIPIAIILIFFIIFYGSFWCRQKSVSKHLNSTVELLSSGNYDTVFITNSTVHDYVTVGFEKYVAKNPLIIQLDEYESNYLSQYTILATQYISCPERVYFEIDPSRIKPLRFWEQVDYTKLWETSLMLGFSEGTYGACLIDSPSIEWWLQQSEKRKQEHLTAIQAFYDAFYSTGFAYVYFYGWQEWLLCNSKLYTNNGTVYSDGIFEYLYPYIFTDNANESTPAYFKKSVENLVGFIARETADSTQYPALDGYQLVLFGDSIYAKNEYPYAIEHVLRDQLGATVYNYSVGGATASSVCDNNFNMQLQRFIDNPPALSEAPCFLINFGLNDYFEGIDAKDSNNTVNSYLGGLSAGIDRLLELYPLATVVVSTPTLCIAYEYGSEPHGNHNQVLTDYVNAAIELRTCKNTYVINNYEDLFPQETAENYLFTDKIHPNEQLCRIIAINLANFVLSLNASAK